MSLLLLLQSPPGVPVDLTGLLTITYGHEYEVIEGHEFVVADGHRYEVIEQS